MALAPALSLRRFLNGPLHDSIHDTVIENGAGYLPFDPSQVADNLRCERYVNGVDGTGRPASSLSTLYYLVRPVLSVGFASIFSDFILEAGTRSLFHSGRSTGLSTSWSSDCFSYH